MPSAAPWGPGVWTASSGAPGPAWAGAQAGFCSPRVMEILARELGVSQAEITKCGGASRLIVGVNKDSLEEVREG